MSGSTWYMSQSSCRWRFLRCNTAASVRSVSKFPEVRQHTMSDGNDFKPGNAPASNKCYLTARACTLLALCRGSVVNYPDCHSRTAFVHQRKLLQQSALSFAFCGAASEGELLLRKSIDKPLGRGGQRAGRHMANRTIGVGVCAGLQCRQV